MEHILKEAIKMLLNLGILVNFKGDEYYNAIHQEAAEVVKQYNEKNPKRNGKLPNTIKKQVAKILKKNFSKDKETRLLVETQMLIFLVKKTFQIQNADFKEDLYDDARLGMRCYPIHLTRQHANVIEDVFVYAEKVGINIGNHEREKKSIWVVIRRKRKQTGGRVPNHPAAKILFENGFKTAAKNDKGVFVQINKNEKSFTVRNSNLSEEDFETRIKEIQAILKQAGYKTEKRVATTHTVIEINPKKITKRDIKKAVKKVGDDTKKKETFLQSLSEIQKEKLLKEVGITIPDPANMDDKELKTLFETLGQNRVVSIMKKAFPDLMIIPKANAL